MLRHELDELVAMLHADRCSWSVIARELGVSRYTVHRALRRIQEGAVATRQLGATESARAADDTDRQVEVLPSDVLVEATHA